MVIYSILENHVNVQCPLNMAVNNIFENEKLNTLACSLNMEIPEEINGGKYIYII